MTTRVVSSAGVLARENVNGAQLAHWKDSRWPALSYFFDACLTCRVPAFTRDLRLTRSGIAA